jgi:hypothetical protein
MEKSRKTDKKARTLLGRPKRSLVENGRVRYGTNFYLLKKGFHISSCQALKKCYVGEAGSTALVACDVSQSLWNYCAVNKKKKLFSLFYSFLLTNSCLNFLP